MELAENREAARAFESLQEELPRLIARIDGLSPSAGEAEKAREELSRLIARVDGLFKKAGLPAGELENMSAKMRSPELKELLEQA